MTTTEIHEQPVSQQRFVPAEQIPADAALVTWTETRGGIHEHKWHRTQRAARAQHTRDGRRDDLKERGWTLIQKSHREHGIMVW